MKEFDSLATDQSITPSKRHRTSTIEQAYISGYPTKLFIYRMPASQYWWVRYFVKGKILRKSTKHTGKVEAISFAKGFFEKIIASGRDHIKKPVVTKFDAVAKMLMETELAKVTRGNLAQGTYDNMEYRLNKSILLQLGAIDIQAIDY